MTNKLLVFIVVSFNILQVNGLCGYRSCPETKAGYLNVHLVSHSHDDVGWLKTVDQYYLGSRQDIGPEAVQYILDSVITELTKNPKRKFIYAETGVFWRWWREQTVHIKQLVKHLVLNGQLEFVSGGWSMNDEACTHYNAIIDQMSLGLIFLNDTFGECAIPKVGWQIDSFGHSRENANIFKEMGFDGLFLGRIDFRDKWWRLKVKEMEMVWMTNPNNFGKEASLFTGVLFNYYMPPGGLCFDQLCKDDPINDDPNIDGYNVEKIAKRFLSAAEIFAEPYNTNNVLMTVGGDFHYMNANMWYKNLDKLIKYVNNYDYKNNTKKVNVFYSTPSCYLKEVHRSGKPLPVKTDDFFPYSSDFNSFWGGYFSSRPTFKYFINKASNFLQACKQLALAGFGENATQFVLNEVFSLSEALALVQDHNVITGTARQHVIDDYSKRISIGMENCEKVIGSAFQKLNPSMRNIIFCPFLNISACPPSEEKEKFTVSVYNPLAATRSGKYIRVPVTHPFWRVESATGLLPPQVIPIPSSVLEVPGRESKAKFELIFRYDFPGLSVINFKIDSIAGEARTSENFLQPIYRDDDIILINSVGLGITLDKHTGLLKSISKGEVDMPVKQNFYYYLAMAEDNSDFKQRPSGAYIFRPNLTAGINPIPVADKIQYKIYKGIHVTEVHQVFNEWVSQVIRLYDKSGFSLEFEWMVGPIPIEDGYGKEIVTKYSTNLETNGVFYTDSNGRQLMKRVRNKRGYKFQTYENVAHNYYPVSTKLIIGEDQDLPLDKGLALMILTDRAEGGTSMNDGEAELLIHRRVLSDDGFSLEEALNETAYGKGLVARGKHWVFIAGNETGIPLSTHRQKAVFISMDTLMGIGNATSKDDLVSLPSAIQSLGKALPQNIHLLTLEALSPSRILLRLEHFYEKGEDQVNSQPVRIPFETIKKVLPFVTSMRETTLGGNQWASELNRFKWPTKNYWDVKHDMTLVNASDSESILLRPMEIKTFILLVETTSS